MNEKWNWLGHMLRRADERREALKWTPKWTKRTGGPKYTCKGDLENEMETT